MSRPRFLTDHDLRGAIVRGVRRHEPLIELIRVRDVGLQASPDNEVLEYAGVNGLIVVSHDVTTMSAAAAARIVSGLRMPGLFLAAQDLPVSVVIDDLILIWAASEAEEWEDVIRFLPV